MVIEHFFYAIDEIFDSIIALESTKYVNNHKITLIFSLLDLLSKSIYGNKHRHNEKFQMMLKEFYPWQYLNFVSIQMLNLELLKNNEKEFDILRDFVKSHVENYPDAEPLRLNYDIDIDEISKIWPKGKKLNKNRIENFTHKRLIYINRNSLVHEMRPKGSQFQLFDIHEPHYTPFSKISIDSNGTKYLSHDTWQLVYPIEFFISMFKDIRKNIEEFMIKNNYDPYKYLNFSDNWME